MSESTYETQTWREEKDSNIFEQSTTQSQSFLSLQRRGRELGGGEFRRGQFGVVTWSRGGLGRVFRGRVGTGIREGRAGEVMGEEDGRMRGWL